MNDCIFFIENWNRDPAEIQVLMKIFEEFMDRIAEDAVKKNIQVQILMSNPQRLSEEVRSAVKRIEDDTAHCTGFILSLCVRYLTKQRSFLLLGC